MEPLKITSILFAVPAGISMVILVFWGALARIRMQRLVAAGGIGLIFACALVILFASIWEPAVNVSLKGMRFSIDDRLARAAQAAKGGTTGDENKGPVAAEFRVGGGREAEAGRPADDIYVNGYPRDAFRLVASEGKLLLKPGEGYHSRLLAVSGGKLVGVTHEGGLPRILPVRRGDRIEIAPNESRTRIQGWTLGPGSGQLDPPDLAAGRALLSLGGEEGSSPGAEDMLDDLELGSEAIFSVETEAPVFALTFDDGPHAQNTPRLLDILKESGVKATFFLTGQNADAHPEIVRRIAEEGHEIGNHTWSHPTLTRIGDEAVEAELRKGADAILKARPETRLRFFRPPSGALRQSQREAIHEKFGYQTVLWSVDPRDWTRPGSQVVTNRTVSHAKPGGIVVLHDIHGPTIDAVPGIIRGLREKGLQPVKLSEVLARRTPARENLEETERSAPVLPPALKGYRPDTIRIGRVGDILKLEAGEGWSADVLVTIDGKPIDLANSRDGSPAGEPDLVFRPGETRLAVSRRDALAGEVRVEASTLKTVVSWRRHGDWDGESYPILAEILPSQRDVRVGGGLGDTLFLQGFPEDSFRLNADHQGWQILPGEGWPSALELGYVREEWLDTRRPAEGGEPLDIGRPDTGMAGAIRAEGFRSNLAAGREALLFSWVPAERWDYRLPSRVVEIPIFDYPIPLPIQLPGLRRAYPLREGATRYSPIRSSLVYGMGHWSPGVSLPDTYLEWFRLSNTGASLLVLDPGVEVIGGDGAPVAGGCVAEVAPGAPLEFWELLATVDSPPAGELRLPTQAAEVETLRRLGRWETFSNIAVKAPEKDGEDAYLVITRGTAAIETVRERLLRDLAKIEESEDFGLSFSINDPLDFSTREQRSNLHFGGLSSVFRECYADITLVPTRAEAKALQLNLRGDEFLMTTGAGAEVKRYGDEILIGDKEQLILEVIKRDIPKRTMGFVMFGGVVTAIAGWWLLETAAGFALMAGLSMLTCARVLFGHAALVAFPYNEEALPLALSAMLLVPFVCGAMHATAEAWLSRRTGARQVARVTIFAGCYLAILILCLREFHLEPGKVVASAGLLTAALLTLGFVTFAKGGGRKAAKPKGPMIRPTQWMAGPGYRTLWGVLALVIALRIALFLGGMKESLEVVGRFALSIVFVPLLILLFVLATQRFLRRAASRERAPFVGYLAFVAGLFVFQLILNGFVISDMGAYIYLIPISLLLPIAGLAILRRGSFIHYGFFLLPAVAIGVGLFQALPLIEAVKPSLARDISESNSIWEGRNQLRLLYSINPLRVEGLGTDLADQIAQEHAIIDSYARHGWMGEGFLNVDVIAQKRKTALNDNVSAIYLLAQFGAIGGCAVIWAYLLFAATPVALAFRGDCAGAARRRLGILLTATAGAILALTSIYMIAANCGLVPFTGKNLYLLSLDSLSDVFESTVLLSIVATGIALATTDRGEIRGAGGAFGKGRSILPEGHREFLPESLK